MCQNTVLDTVAFRHSIQILSELVFIRDKISDRCAKNFETQYETGEFESAFNPTNLLLNQAPEEAALNRQNGTENKATACTRRAEAEEA